MSTPDETPNKNLGWLPPEVEAAIPEIQKRQEEAEERISSMFDAPGPGDKALNSRLKKREEEVELSLRQKEGSLKTLLTGRRVALTFKYLNTSDIREAMGEINSMITYLPIRITRMVPLTGVAVVDAPLLVAEPEMGTITVEVTDMQAALLGLSSGADRATFNAKAMNVTVSKADTSAPQGWSKVIRSPNPDLSADQTAMLTGRFEDAQETSDSHDALHDGAQSQGRTDARAGMDAELQQMRDDAPEPAWAERVIPEASALAESPEMGRPRQITPELDRVFASPHHTRSMDFRTLNNLMAELNRMNPRVRSRVCLNLEYLNEHNASHVAVTASIITSRSLWEDLK